MTQVPYSVLYRLKDQTPVELCLVCPQDRERLLNGFARISTKSNIDRFLAFKKGFTEDELDYLLRIDNIDHLAIGALDRSGRPDVGIGIARYVRIAEQPGQAEAAIIVIDTYQKRGLGKLLYTELMKKAYENNIRRFINIVGKDNLAMSYLLQSLGAKKRLVHEQVYEFTVNLSNSLNQLYNSRKPWRGGIFLDPGCDSGFNRV